MQTTTRAHRRVHIHLTPHSQQTLALLRTLVPDASDSRLLRLGLDALAAKLGHRTAAGLEAELAGVSR